MNVEKITNLDIQFNSHRHGDHHNIRTTKQLWNQTGAKIVVEPDIYKRMTNKRLKTKIPENAIFRGNPAQALNIDGFTINSINGRHLCPISLFRVEWNDFSVIHGSDSDYIPLADYEGDVAFIPTGSPSPTCSPEKGLKMALDIKPTVTVAMHGTKEQMTKFKVLVAEELPETEVVIPEENKLSKLSKGISSG